MVGKAIISQGYTFALITVTYPAGSTCTCVCGSRTLRAKDTTGSFVFSIPYAGEWVVSCTNGTQTKSSTVSITTKGQIETITLSYTLVIFDNGYVEPYTTIATAYTKNNAYSSVGNTINMWGSASGYNNSYKGLYFPQAIDVTNYSALDITCYKTGKYYWVELSNGRLGISASIPSNEGSFITYIAPSYDSHVTKTIDLTNRSGNVYIHLCGEFTMSEGAGYVYVSKIVFR